MRLVDRESGVYVREAGPADVAHIAASIYGTGRYLHGGFLVEGGRVLVLDWPELNGAQIRADAVADWESVQWR